MSVKTLSLITGNTEKYEGFKSMLGPDFSYVTVKQDIKVPEYQGTPQEICKAKCEAAARILNAPVVIIDNALCINAWGGLPGPYVKWFKKSVGQKGISKMLTAWEDKSAYNLCVLGYSDGSLDQKGIPKTVLFETKQTGQIVEPLKETVHFHDGCFKKDEGSIECRYEAVRQLKEYLSNL